MIIIHLVNHLKHHVYYINFNTNFIQLKNILNIVQKVQKAL